MSARSNMSLTDPTITETTRPSTGDGDHDRFTHIVLPASAVAEAVVTGKPCRALCGKVWVPSHDPKRYPICPTCKDVASAFGWKVPRG
ncbi:MAG: DUF3039 domain-containing protein [Acidimicrobiales bacterium]|nr:DUF3039 domain-containing protein [Acidimicrobiales bacterium]MBO0893626.1 DUF3039 domain-containing protein [Acidimicrobiales bacterium]